MGGAVGGGGGGAGAAAAATSTTKAEDEPAGPTEVARLAEAKPPEGAEAQGSERAVGARAARRAAVAAAVRVAR